MASKGVFRQYRILILLLILFFVAVEAWLTKLRTTDWDAPLYTVVYPINGDSSEQAQAYIHLLSRDSFSSIESFMREEAQAYGVSINEPVKIALGHQIHELPPKLVQPANVFQTMLWSLRMRYWAYRVDNYQGPPANIKMFVVYFNPEARDKLDHSLGLEKGLIGVVNAFAHTDYNDKNNVVIAHELLHTVGASDKYNPSGGAPIFPIGFAEPEKQPLYPQTFAEIMAGAVAVSEREWHMPESLRYVTVGRETAIEIGWIDSLDNEQGSK